MFIHQLKQADRTDMKKLRYLKSAKDWDEALPVGNGYIGAMVFGGVNRERIQMNEDSLWSGGFIDRSNKDSLLYLSRIRELLFEGRIGEAELLASRSMYAKHPHMRHYQTLGDVWIEFFDTHPVSELYKDINGLVRIEKKSPNLQEYVRELDLSQAVGSVKYKMNDILYEREYFASYHKQVLIYRIKAHTRGKVNFDLSLARRDLRAGRGSSFCDGVEAYDGLYAVLHGHQGGRDDGLDFVMAAKVVSSGGKQFQMGSHLIVEDADEAVIYITGRTSYRSSDPQKWCLVTLEQAALLPYEDVRKEHMEDYKQYFDQMSLEFEKEDELELLPTDERLNRIKAGKLDVGILETYCDFGRYLLISSSREGSLPSNLQGIWNQEFEPAWGSKYTININTQMNYWLAEKTGLSKLHMPLLEHLKILREKGKDVAKNMYGARGFCCHHNMDIWGDCAPQDNHMPATIWPMGGAWLVLHIWEHFEYTRDMNFLQEYFPIMRDAVLFYVDYMVCNKQGEWVTGPSVSPENIYVNESGEMGSLCMGPSMDSQILHELFTGYLNALKELKIHDDIEEDVRIRLAGLPPIKIGKYGQIQEWSEDYEEIEIGHRHISQLFALYPGKQIDIETDQELAKAAVTTLRRRLDNGGGHTGWSKAWIINFWAHLQNSQEAYNNLNELLVHSTLNNLMDYHPPFQIDGNFGGASGILEMLFQESGNKVLILPALPKEFNTGKVKGLRSKSGAIFDIFWKDGLLKGIKIIATRDGEMRLHIPGNVLKKGKGIEEQRFISKNEICILNYEP